MSRAASFLVILLLSSQSSVVGACWWGPIIFPLLFPFCFPWSSGYGGAAFTLNWDLPEHSSDNYSAVLSLQIQNGILRDPKLLLRSEVQSSVSLNHVSTQLKLTLRWVCCKRQLRHWGLCVCVCVLACVRALCSVLWGPQASFSSSGVPWSLSSAFPLSSHRSGALARSYPFFRLFFWHFLFFFISYFLPLCCPCPSWPRLHTLLY